MLAVGALYPGTERGLAADIAAARALSISLDAVCTGIVAAGQGRVTDVIEVPSDAVDAQLEHVFGGHGIVAAKVGILGSARSAEVLFRRLDQYAIQPLLLDVKLSGPSGEDIADGRVIDQLKDNFGRAALVSVNRTDAELLTRMSIESLDDAQVAAQRLSKLGAKCVLLRCGDLPMRFFEAVREDRMFSDLFFDGSEFSLYEAPYLSDNRAGGASSGLSFAILKNLSSGNTLAEAIQIGKAYVSEAVRHTQCNGDSHPANFFWNVGRDEGHQ